jgi:hypothetical protein
METDRADNPLRWSRQLEAWMDYWRSKGRDLQLPTSDTHTIMNSQMCQPAAEKIWNTHRNTVLDAKDELSRLPSMFHLVTTKLKTVNIFDDNVVWAWGGKAKSCPIPGCAPPLPRVGQIERTRERRVPEESHQYHQRTRIGAAWCVGSVLLPGTQLPMETDWLVSKST